jgi:hypothetical protein
MRQIAAPSVTICWTPLAVASIIVARTAELAGGKRLDRDPAIRFRLNVGGDAVDHLDRRVRGGNDIAPAQRDLLRWAAAGRATDRQQQEFQHACHRYSLGIAPLLPTVPGVLVLTSEN